MLAVTALRLVVADRAPLSADEAYYWVWSRALAGGYLDHPPMVALWIRAGTALVGQTSLGVRLLGPFSALLGTLLLMRAAADFWPDQPARRVSLVAACLLNATLVVSVGAVVMTPDTPLLFFWTAALACLGRLVRTGRGLWWLGVGAASGLALDSKYTAALLGASILGWLVCTPSARRWLASWQLWTGGLLALACFVPVLAWNADHGWASLAKQGARAGDWQPMRAAQFVAELVAGQVGLATPWVAVLLAGGVAGLLRRDTRHRAGPALLAWVTVLPACVFLAHAFGDRVQANWPAVLYPGAVLAACAAAATWRAASLTGAAVAAMVYLQAARPVLALPRAVDFTLIRLAGWSDLAGQVYAAQLAAGARAVVADEYGLAAQLAWRLRSPVLGVEQRWSYFNMPAAQMDGADLLLVRSARTAGAPDPRLWSSIRLIGEVARGRAGEVAETYRLYAVRWSSGDRATEPLGVILPHRPIVPVLKLP